MKNFYEADFGDSGFPSDGAIVMANTSRGARLKIKKALLDTGMRKTDLPKFSIKKVAWDQAMGDLEDVMDTEGTRTTISTLSKGLPILSI